MIPIKHLKGYRMDYDPEFNELFMERDGIRFLIVKKGELHSVIRGLVTCDQKFHRRHVKK
jgi:hypothetical protein